MCFDLFYNLKEKWMNRTKCDGLITSFFIYQKAQRSYQKDMARVKEARSTNIQALVTHDNGQATAKGSAVSEGIKYLLCYDITPFTIYYHCAGSELETLCLIGYKWRYLSPPKKVSYKNKDMS